MQARTRRKLALFRRCIGRFASTLPPIPGGRGMAKSFKDPGIRCRFEFPTNGIKRRGRCLKASALRISARMTSFRGGEKAGCARRLRFSECNLLCAVAPGQSAEADDQADQFSAAEQIILINQQINFSPASKWLPAALCARCDRA
jgi:hypothetical protein